VTNAPAADHPQHARFTQEIGALRQVLAQREDFHAGKAVRKAFALIRKEIAFFERDRAMDGDVRRLCELVAAEAFAAVT